MGFSLQLGSIDMMAHTPAEQAGLREFISRHQLQIEEHIDPNNFQDDFFEVEGFEIESGTDDNLVLHWEVGWSWWKSVQAYMVSVLGEGGCQTALGIHAFHGVAIPGSFDNFHIGPTTTRKPKDAPKGFLRKMGFGKRDTKDETARMIDEMILAYGGPLENLMVVSGDRLSAELGACIDASNLDRSRLQELYESADGKDERIVAKSGLLIFDKFLTEGLKHNHLVWWQK